MALPLCGPGWVSAARDLGPRLSLTGESLAPIFEHVAAAQSAGLISPGHAREIVAAFDRLPDQVAAQRRERSLWLAVRPDGSAGGIPVTILATLTAGQLTAAADPLAVESNAIGESAAARPADDRWTRRPIGGPALGRSIPRSVDSIADPPDQT